MKKDIFPQDVARFFHPEKSLVNPPKTQKGTHQEMKRKESSYIPVYSGMGTARAVFNKYGLKSYI